MTEMQTTENQTALAERLQRLEDLEEIRQLFIDYGHYLDSGNFAAYGELFADEGEVLLGAIGRAKGPTAIEALMRQTMEGAGGRASTSCPIPSSSWTATRPPLKSCGRWSHATGRTVLR